jgi:hypothetical protein
MMMAVYRRDKLDQRDDTANAKQGTRAPHSTLVFLGTRLSTPFAFSFLVNAVVYIHHVGHSSRGRGHSQTIDRPQRRQVSPSHMRDIVVKYLSASHGTDLKAKVNGVNELRTYVDRVRDVEGLSNLTALAPGFLQLLRVGEPAFVKESPELVFRKTLIDVILRMLYADVTHFPFLLFFGLVIHLIRHDNEDNAISALKALADCARMLKPIPPDTFIDFSSAFSEVCRNVHQHALELFTSAPPPAHLVTPAIRSIRTLTEITNVVVAFVSSHRGLPHPAFQNVLPLNFQILQLEIPVQKQAREEHEMTNAIWAGMSPAITNAQDYEDLLLCQSRVSSCFQSFKANTHLPCRWHTMDSSCYVSHLITSVLGVTLSWHVRCAFFKTSQYMRTIPERYISMLKELAYYFAEDFRRIY